VDAEDVRAQVLAWRALGSASVAAGDIEAGRDAYAKALAAATATEAVSEAPQTRRLLAALPLPAPPRPYGSPTALRLPHRSLDAGSQQ
jgi:hypothetical protein